MNTEKKKLPVLKKSVTAIDSHCHLDMSAFETDLQEVLLRARNCGVALVITIGIDAQSSKRAVELARDHDMVRATIGIHPHHALSCNRAACDLLSRLFEDNRDLVVGYGEIGLDYAKMYAPRQVQKESFALQLGVARELELPIIVHDRDAHDDTLTLLRENGPYPAGGVMHCFSGDLELAEAVMDLGFFVSIPGIVTFAKASMLQEVARKIPLQRMLLETDGPFLAPVPQRGKRNEPAFLLYTAREIARLRSISLEEVVSATSANARSLFHLKNQP